MVKIRVKFDNTLLMAADSFHRNLNNSRRSIINERYIIKKYL